MMQKTYPLEAFNGAVEGYAFARECELSGLVPAVLGVSTSSGDPDAPDTATVHLEGDELSAAQLEALDDLVAAHAAPPPVVFDPLAEDEPALQRADVQRMIDEAASTGGVLGLSLAVARVAFYVSLAAAAGLAAAQFV